MLEFIFSLAFLVSAASAPDSSAFVGRESQEVMDITERHDTLRIISTAPDLFYPFGKTDSPRRFSQRMKVGALVTIDSAVAEGSDSKVYAAASKLGVVRYLLIDRVGETMVELISAEYAAPGLKMENGIAVGETKERVFGRYLVSELKPDPSK